MQIDFRPEDEMRESQALLEQLEGLLDMLRQDITDTRASLAKNEKSLAELLQNQTEDEYYQRLGKEIQTLLTRWGELRATLDQNLQNNEAKQELIYVEDSLRSAINEKLRDQEFTKKEIQFIKTEILSESQHLRSTEEQLADWDLNKEEILKDVDRLRKEVEKFNQMYRSKN